MSLEELERELSKVRAEYFYLQATQPDYYERLKFLEARIEALEKEISRTQEESSPETCTG